MINALTPYVGPYTVCNVTAPVIRREEDIIHCYRSSTFLPLGAFESQLAGEYSYTAHAVCFHVSKLDRRERSAPLEMKGILRLGPRAPSTAELQYTRPLSTGPRTAMHDRRQRD